MPENDPQTLAQILAIVREKLKQVAGSDTVIDLEARLQMRELREQIASLETALDAAVSLYEVPLALCQALRAEPGTMHTVAVDVDGKAVGVAISPTGQADPVNEVRVWEDIRAAAQQTAGGLRPMAAPIGAVQAAADVVVVNATLNRGAARAAIRVLRHSWTGIPAFAPLAWLLGRSRRKARAGVAAAGVVAVTAGVVFAAASQPAETGHAKDNSVPGVVAEANPSPADPPTLPASPVAGTPDERDEVPDVPAPVRQVSPPASPEPARGRERSREPSKPSPAASPRRSTPGRTVSPAVPAEQPTSDVQEDPPAAEPETPKPPPPPPSPPPAAPEDDCGLLGVNVDLPILDVDLCL